MQPYPPLGTLYAARVLPRTWYLGCRLRHHAGGSGARDFARRCGGRSRRIFAIYEDDFNFLSKMCLTRMRELAWQLRMRHRRQVRL